MEALDRIDTVAYVRFASVYKNFQAADDFDKFVAELRPPTFRGRVTLELTHASWRLPFRWGGAGGGRLAKPRRGLCDLSRGRIVGRGWTQRGGRPHAETGAWRRPASWRAARRLMSRSNPVRIHGKTPPCAQALIDARRGPGGHRAAPTPTRASSGSGAIAMLRAAGIAVETLASPMGEARVRRSRSAFCAARSTWAARWSH